jgi:gliding motility-associated-like protein
MQIETNKNNIRKRNYKIFKLMNRLRLIFIISLICVFGYSQQRISIKEGQWFELDTSQFFSNTKGVFNVIVNSTNVTCFGRCDGTITITLQGTPTYPVQIRLTKPPDQGGGFVFYNNLQASDFPFTITDLCGSYAPYSIRVRDNDGSTVFINNIFILAPAEMSIEDGDYNVVNETCAGYCDGSVEIYYVSNAQGNTYYQWSSGETTASITNKCANTYFVTVTDDMGCTKVFDFNVLAPPLLNVDSVNYTAIFCQGSSGSITVFVSGGNEPYAYDIGYGYQVGNTFTGLSAGTYTVTVIDANNCTVTTNPITIQENPALNISSTHQNVQCAGDANGSINLTVTGGTPGYTYTWTGPSCPCPNSPNLTNLIAGTYNVTVTDANNCTGTHSVVITSPNPINISSNQTNVTCNGGNDGSISLTVIGGIPPYTYTWTGPSCPCPNSPNLTNLKAGSYNVTVRDANNCTATTTIIITEPTAINIVGSLTNVNCFGECSGTITLNVSGGTPPYNYNWNGPSCPCPNSPNLTNLCAGFYFVTVTDANNCTRVRSFQIISPPDIVINAFVQNPNCEDACNGFINLNVNGGTPPFTYQWSHGPTTQNVTNLCAGTYTVTVRDSRNCTKTRVFNITNPPGMILSENHVDVTCYGLNDGSIDLTVSGTYTNPLSYNWSGPNNFSSNNEDISNLYAGTYNVTVTDGAGCTKTLSVNINSQSRLLVSAVVTNVTCFGNNDGSINISVTGGIIPYSYQWTGPGGFSSNNEDISNLVVGTYYLTVTDNLSCSKDTFFEITGPNPIAINYTKQDVSCYGLSNGAIFLSVSDGTPPYFFNWTGPSCPCPNSPNLTNLTAGTYNVTVTDANNCTATTSINITQPSQALSVSETHTNVSCFDGNNGSINLTVSGGTPGYSYTWTGPSCPCPNSPNLTNLTAGTYNVTVTDANNCTATTSINITQPSQALNVSETHTNVSCFGGNNGSISLTVSGGTPGYSYTWTGPSCPCPNSPNLTNISGGFYNVTVTDANSCSATLTVIVSEPSEIVITPTITNVNCYGQCNGSISVSVSGGFLPYSYSWSGPSCPCTGNNITNLCAGTYNLTVTDGNGCTKIASYDLTQPNELVADITSQTNMQCGGNCVGSATVTATGGTPGYTYLWSNGQTVPTATGLCAGWVYVTVTDANNCIAKDSTEILAPPAINAQITDSLMSCGSFPTVVAGTTFLPDGTGVSYTTTITQVDFLPGQVITSANDISSICINMEHSWLGDLSIRLICPNGQSVILKQYPGGGGTFLGEPVSWGSPDQNSNNTTPGNGYDYCFVPSGAMFGTMVQTANTYVYSYIDNAGNPHNNRFYLPAGTYTPFQSLSNLVGCPLNGNWTIEVTDNLALDNGYIFSWLINFAPHTYPPQFCNGAATLTVNGGQAPFSYYWSNGATTQNLSDVCSGTYCVTVTDANNCTATDCVIIVDANLNIDSISKTDASCSGVCNGSATVHYSISAGTVNFLWSNGATTQTITNLCLGTYYVTVSTPNGCSDTASVTISNGVDLQLQTTINTPILCYGECTGSATVNVLNGQAPYTYNWFPNNFDNGPVINNKCAGTYFVTVTDFNGCSVTGSVVFNQPPQLIIDSVRYTNISPCNGNNNGTITIYVSGGTPNYLYNIGTGNQVSNQFINLSAGTYTPTITDANGCTVVGQPITITEPAVLVINSITKTNVTPCFGSANGSITINVSGGQPPYLYNIGNGNQASNVFTGLSGGTYNITVTDQLGCTIVSNNITINEPLPLSLDLVNKTDVACDNQCTGTLEVTGNGGIPPYSYSWNPNIGNGNSFTNLCAGWYFATVTDNLGCTATNQFEIKDTSNLTLNLVSQNNPSCFGLCDGSIEVSTTGGTPPYTYSWNNGLPAIPLQTDLCANTYSVTVYDVNSCQRSLYITLVEPQQLNDSLKITSNILCNGLCTGEITAYPYGGTGMYTYQWDDPANSITQTISNLCSNWYRVTITDQNNCTKVDSLFLPQPDSIQTSLEVVSAISCYGVCDGAVAINVSGGISPYSLLWSNSGTTDTITNLCSGFIYVTVTDNNGCQKVDSIELTQPDSIQISFINVVQVSCGGNCNGQATVQVTGGTPNYSYQWSASAGNQTTQTADSLCGGIHFVTVTDANGCINSNYVAIDDTSNLTLNILLQQNPLCFNSCDGAITVSASGGYPPYTYLWDGGLPSQPSQTNLCAGTYTVTVVDDSLCVYPLLIDLTNPPLLEDSIKVVQNILCNGNCDGIAEVYPYGGTPPYSFLWSNGSNLQQIENLCEGWYKVTITDANGCNKLDSIQLVQPPALVTNLTLLSAITCNGLCNASVSVNANGGTLPYSFNWSNGETTNPAVNLCAGWNYVTITDVNLCSHLDSIFITEPAPISLTLSSTPVPCSSTCTGTATVSVNGGTAPFTYVWNNGQMNSTATSLCGGTYFVTVTDANLCTAVGNVDVVDTSNLQIILINVQNPLCYNQCNGIISVDGIGGYPPYTFSWSTGNNGNTINNLCAGDYTVTITDDSTCQKTTIISLTNPPQLEDSIKIIQSISCFASCDGSVAVFPYGGTPPYSFIWDDPLLSNNDTLTYLCDGTYHVTITDANGCTLVDSVLLQQPTIITSTLQVSQAINCYGICNGIVTANVNGGTSPYNYLWSNNDNTFVADSLCAGWVYLTIADASGCIKVDSIELVQPDSLHITFDDINAASCGVCNGSVTAVVTGGVAPYSYLWDANANNQTTATADSLCVNIYFITVTDANGCTKVANVSIIDTSNLTLNITNIHHITCAGACDGSATASVSGGYPPYTYLWSTIPPQTDSTAINLCAGTYFITVVDDSSCSRVGMVDITDAFILAVLDSVVPISCPGLCDASIILIPTGGTPPYVSYQWSIPGETDSIASNLCPGTYYYSVTDASGCLVTDSVTIVDPGQMIVTINILQPILCNGNCNGSLGVTITGALGPYQYQWSNGSTDAILTDLCAGIYSVTVTGVGGCSESATINLTEPTPLTIQFTNILQVACGGDCSGRVTALVSGGIPPYTYVWTATGFNAITPTIDSLCADLYFITVTDNNGCTLTSMFEVTDTSNLELHIIDSSMVTCYGLCNGWATAQAQNGYPPYNYQWNTIPMQSTATATDLCAGIYLVTVTDDSLCSRVRMVNITQPDSLYLIIKDSLSILCYNECSGSLTISAIGGTQPYEFLWNNSITDTVISSVCAGLYSVTVTDKNQCTNSLTYLITQPLEILYQVSTISSLCNLGTNDGSATINISGGLSPYTIQWNTSDTTTTVDSLYAGTYYFTITDANGCQKSDSVIISPSIVVNAIARKDTTICYGDSVQIFGFGGSVYYWTPGTGLSDSILFNPYAKPLVSTTYYFFVFDSICYDVDSVRIGVHPQFTVDAGQNQTILYDHETYLQGSCSDPTASFLWIPSIGLQDSSSLTTLAKPLQTTTYYLLATNANGCTVIDSVIITVVPKIRVPSGFTPNGDGINDVWIIDLIELFPNCEVMIFNRWGEKLFYSRGYHPSERFDGTYKGKPLPTGTYYYIINLHDEAYKEPLTGPLTIMR